ncbi:MAG: hypothetical protein GC180_04825 [Bacteroidetes bacterium]|nr:hypothetical protein [Bacteroidota bacterium]
MKTAREELDLRWEALQIQLHKQFGNKPDLNMVLILIGIRELGKVKQKWTKEDKVNLMHIAVCRLMSEEGYYELEGLDKDGWPHWKALKKLPFINLPEQEFYLMERVIAYFDAL